MAWNEPGGGNNKGPRDPWGGGDQGPPDLDEVLKKLQEKFGGLFGGGSGKSGGGSGGGGISGRLVGVLIAILIGIWFFMGLYQVDEQERAVVLRFGKYVDTVGPGLHWNPPLVDEVVRDNTTKVRAITFDEIMLTKDENIVEIKMSLQYVIDDLTDFVLKVRDPEVSLQHAAQSALRHVIGDTRMDMALTEARAQIAIDVHTRLQRYLDNYETGIRVSKINIDESRPPRQVQSAFDDVIKAREDEERVKNEAQAYANGVIPEARGAAQRQFEDASAYKEGVVANAQGEAARFKALLTEYNAAPEVTRGRLYLDAVQAVFGSTRKVLVDVEGGNNMMYLPLDKLGLPQSTSSSRRIATDSMDSTTLRQITDAVTDQLRRDAASSSSSTRGGR